VQSFVLLSPVFKEIAWTVCNYDDVLAAILDFNFSENFKVCPTTSKINLHIIVSLLQKSHDFIH